MPLEEPSKNSKNNEEETIVMVVPKKLMRRPFPLVWGLASLALFVVFAFITIYQFNQISNDKLHDAQLKQYETELQAYNTAVKANQDCLGTIAVRETYRGIFGGIEKMFQSTADLPVQLFPDGEIAKQYQQTLRADVEKYISEPVADGLPPKKAADCPQIPDSVPEKP